MTALVLGFSAGLGLFAAGAVAWRYWPRRRRSLFPPLAERRKRRAFVAKPRPKAIAAPLQTPSMSGAARLDAIARACASQSSAALSEITANVDAHFERTRARIFDVPSEGPGSMPPPREPTAEELAKRADREASREAERQANHQRAVERRRPTALDPEPDLETDPSRGGYTRVWVADNKGNVNKI